MNASASNSTGAYISFVLLTWVFCDMTFYWLVAVQAAKYRVGVTKLISSVPLFSRIL